MLCMQHAASGVTRTLRTRTAGGRLLYIGCGRVLRGGGRRIRGRYGKGDEICWGRCVCKCIKPEEKK